MIGLTLITAFSMPLHAQQEQGVPDPSNGLSITYNIYIPDTTRDDWDIIHMNLDGSGKCNVIHHPDVAWTYEAYGDRLLFISDRDTSIVSSGFMNATGKESSCGGSAISGLRTAG